MGVTSPTQRCLKLLREEGYVSQVVEKWNPYAKIRQDLFGFIDVVAIQKGIILGVQATSDGNISARVKKSKALPALKTWLQAGGLFEVWGFGKKGPRGKRKVWTVRKVSITLEDL